MINHHFAVLCVGSPNDVVWQIVESIIVEMKNDGLWKRLRAKKGHRDGDVNSRCVPSPEVDAPIMTALGLFQNAHLVTASPQLAVTPHKFNDAIHRANSP